MLRGIVLHASHVRRKVLATMGVLFVAGTVCVMGPSLSHGVQRETQEEKAANLKQQAKGGLFQQWPFDQEPLGGLPHGFVKAVSSEEPLAEWVVQLHPTAPSPPHVVAALSNCRQSCYQVLLAEGMQYEYPDVSVRLHASPGIGGSGGVVLGVRDAKNFYGAIVDLVTQQVRFIRLSSGIATILGQATVNLKPVDWHTLRVQRNTIISKDFIEVFMDGTLVLSVEDQALGLGQVGFVVSDKSAMLFDSFHAVPLFSHRPLSPPPAY
ncbi:MAG: hypothetical protein JNL29_16455 [Nitrospira sp.]|nr:hypothetical protein [Nitrospira sp.]